MVGDPGIEPACVSARSYSPLPHLAACRPQAAHCVCRGGVLTSALNRRQQEIQPLAEGRDVRRR